jgi:glycosyltransferase involved in cell wall biosynthesis
MNSRRPLFSFVVPAYNASDTIDATIKSVLAQSCDDWEIVITDDGSTDTTRAVIDVFVERDHRIQVHSQPNAGAGAAISAAIERASGEFIVQLGADDELLPEFCTVMRDFIEAHPGFDIYASNSYRLHPDGLREPYHSGARFQHVFSLKVDDLLDEPAIYGTAAFRREWFDRVGGFRTEFYSEDYDFWLRAMMAGAKHIYTPEKLALYRVTPGQKTEDGVLMRQEDIKILRDAIESGQLSPEQVAHAQRTIEMLKKNIAFRKRVTSLVGPRMAKPIFGAAHKAAWLVRPHRRQR